MRKITSSAVQRSSSGHGLKCTVRWSSSVNERGRVSLLKQAEKHSLSRLAFSKSDSAAVYRDVGVLGLLTVVC